LGLIIEIHPECDGHARVAKVKTADGEKIRLFQRFFPLEVCSAARQLLIKESSIDLSYELPRNRPVTPGTPMEARATTKAG
jgi:hypothetical protein